MTAVGEVRAPAGAARAGGAAAVVGSVVRQAAASLLAHPLRSVLTALGVAFGAAVLFVLLGYGTSMPKATSDLLHRLGSRELVADPGRLQSTGGGRGRRIRIRYADLPAIRAACPSIASIAPLYRPSRGQPVFTATRSWPWASLHGVGHEYRDVTDLRVLHGRWFTHEEEQLGHEVALVNLPLAEGLFDESSPLGRTIDFAGRRFTIVGVFESRTVFAYGMLVPYPTAMAMGDEGGRYVSEVAFAPRRRDLAPAAIDELRTAIGTLYSFDPSDTRALEIEENTDFVAKVRAASLGLEWLVLTIAGLALVLGCLGAANVVGIAVAERTAELGLRKALGATGARLRAEVLAETLMLCLLGGMLGVLVGVLTIAAIGPIALDEQVELAPRVDLPLLLGAVVVLVGTATLAGLPAAARAARLDPIAALREA